MTTEEKALALLNEVQGSTFTSLTRDSSAIEALCRAIEQHEAFRQEVSDALLRYHAPSHVPHGLQEFIIPAPKPDPLEEVLREIDHAAMWVDECAKEIRASLDARGFEIREKG